MKRKHLRLGKGFHTALGNRRAQAAQMVLAPGDREGGPDNRHRGSDQWLYVVSGAGAATVNGKRLALRPGTLLLIEHGDTHEIRNTGRTPFADAEYLRAARIHCKRRPVTARPRLNPAKPHKEMTMGWLRYFFLGDFGQQLDLHQHEADIAKLKKQLDTQKGPVATKDALKALRRENDELKLYVVALLRLLIAKKVATVEEIRALVDVIDREDGAADGRYEGEILPEASKPSKAGEHSDKVARTDKRGTPAQPVAAVQSQCPACGAAIPENSARCPSCDIALT